MTIPAPRQRSWVPITAVALLVLTLGGIWWWREKRSDARAQLLSLAAPVRPGVVRLADAPHFPPAPVTRGEETSRPDWGLLAESARIRKAAERQPSAANLHALGLAHLLLGQLEDAVSVLRRARSASADSGIAVDLSAALIHQGMRQERPDLVAQGLEVLAALPQPLPEAAGFDKAIAFESLGLYTQADLAWKRYLAFDSTSPWAAEARQRLAKLRRTAGTIGRASEPIEREVLDRLLPQWAEASLAGRMSDADAALSRARALAAAHQARHRDPLLSAVIADVEASTRQRQSRLASAVRSYARARAAYIARDLVACPALAEQAVERLIEVGSPLVPLAVLTTGNCGYLRNELGQCARRVEEAARLASTQPHPSALARGQIAWLGGLAAHAAGDPAESLAHYRVALSAFQSGHDDLRTAMVHALLADLYEYLGRTEAAWSEAVLSARSPGLEPRRRYAPLHVLVRLAAADGLPHVAVEAATAADAEAQRTGDAGFIADAKLGLGRAWGRLGDYTKATSSFRQGLGIARKIAEPHLRNRAIAFASAELAEAMVASDPAKAYALALEAEGMEGAAGDLFVLLARVRAAAKVRQNRLEDAEAILRAAAARSAVERGDLGSLEARDEAFDRRTELHHDLVRLLIRRNQPEAALAVLDAWRSESLPHHGSVWPAAGNAHHLAPDEVWAFLTLPDELLSWRLHNGAVRLRHIALPRAAVAALVTDAVAEARSGSKGTHSLTRLANLLFDAPLDGRRVVIIPDSLLFAAPFTALPDPSSGQPLIVAHEIVLAPSISAWLRHAASPGSNEGCSLLIRGASSGGELYPHLPPLPLLVDELAAVGRRQRCTASAATAEELRQQVHRSHGVIHYAGHSITGGAAGSALLMQGPRGPIAISAGEVETWDLAGASVVLGSCSTADGRPSTIAGRDSLSHAFLAAGARSVIANLWPVADLDSLELTTRVHDRIARGEEVASALRAAQLELRQAGRPPASWAGWVAMAGG